MTEEQEANARLIAAAPDLLDACEKALEWVCDADLAVAPSMGVLSGEDMARMLHAAIAKAKGSDVGGDCNELDTLWQ